MPSTGLGNYYPLNNEKIDAVVKKKSAGAYVLGHLRKEKKNEEEVKVFIPDYVGRSDDDINGRLKKWVGGKYSTFKFGYYDSPKAAFVKECDLYHDWKKQLDNKQHPDRPKNANWKCPRCKVFNGEKK